LFFSLARTIVLFSSQNYCSFLYLIKFWFLEFLKVQACWLRQQDTHTHETLHNKLALLLFASQGNYSA